MMRERLNASPVLVQLPLGEEDRFQGVIDLINMQALVYDEASKGMSIEVGEIRRTTGSWPRSSSSCYWKP